MGERISSQGQLSRAAGKADYVQVGPLPVCMTGVVQRCLNITLNENSAMRLLKNLFIEYDSNRITIKFLLKLAEPRGVSRVCCCNSEKCYRTKLV